MLHDQGEIKNNPEKNRSKDRLHQKHNNCNIQLELLSCTTLASCKMQQKVIGMMHVMSVGSENENQ